MAVFRKAYSEIIEIRNGIVFYSRKRQNMTMHCNRLFNVYIPCVLRLLLKAENDRLR